LFGYDTSQRPALYLFPSRQNTEPPDDPNAPNPQIHITVWMLERAIDLMGPGVECVTSGMCVGKMNLTQRPPYYRNVDLLINFAEKAKNPPFSIAMKVTRKIALHHRNSL